jgi:alkylation response protein AidB-like acyl-CoA dehydrogenase
VDIDLEDHQADLGEVARRFFESRSPASAVRAWESSEAGYSADLWREMAGLGWLQLGHPETAGGAGGGALELSVRYQGMGRTLAPVPHLESAVIGAGVLAAAGTSLARDLLDRVFSGENVVTPALAEDDAGFGPESIALPGKLDANGALRLEGSKILVGYANSASHLIVAVRTAPPGDAAPSGITPPRATAPSGITPPRATAPSGITLALVETTAPGVQLTRLPNTAGYPLYATTFDAVQVGPDGVLGEAGIGWELLGPVLDRAAVLRAAQIQGAAERLLELSVDYASRRTQFGQPIGRYQAVQYLCSDIAIHSHLTSLFVRYAAGLLDAGLPAGKAVSQAKAHASRTARLAPERAHAVHAGIAFISDFDVQLFTRRCRHWELDLGDERYHRERIAAALAA